MITSITKIISKFKNQDVEFMNSIPELVSGLIFAFCILFFTAQPANARNADQMAESEKSLNILKDEIMSYFEPVSGKIASVEGNLVKIDIGADKSVKAGMRFYAYREGEDFLHPVTKEPLGRIEMPIGNVEITTVNANDSTGVIIKGEPEDFIKEPKNIKVKIPGTKIKVLFYHGDVDWFLGDGYYQMLKESGRFELIDTGIETSDTLKIIAEAKAKGANIALVLQSKGVFGSVKLYQRLFWVDDSLQFSEKKADIDMAYVKELRLKAGLFVAREEDVLLSFSLPFGTRRLAVGDIDGDGNPDIIFASGNNIRIYGPGADLKLLWEFKVPLTNEVLWIDTVDTNKNGKDEILITTMQGGDTDFYIIKDDTSAPTGGAINSYIYELHGLSFTQLYKAKDTFIRRLGSWIIGQKYTKRDGYDGKVFSIIYADGKYKANEMLKLPDNINIYDFQIFKSPDGRQAVLSWDESGFIHLYNEKGIRIWTSSEDFGVFPIRFKRESPTVMIDRGEWTVKDRLIIKDFEVLAPKRRPLLGVVSGLGYSSSEIKSFWWNGISIEQRGFLEKIDGEVLDYALMGDRIVVISKPLFGIMAKNILKGGSPFGTMLYIFSLKGR